MALYIIESEFTEEQLKNIFGFDGDTEIKKVDSESVSLSDAKDLLETY